MLSKVAHKEMRNIRSSIYSMVQFSLKVFLSTYISLGFPLSKSVMVTDSFGCRHGFFTERIIPW